MQKTVFDGEYSAFYKILRVGEYGVNSNGVIHCVEGLLDIICGFEYIKLIMVNVNLIRIYCLWRFLWLRT